MLSVNGESVACIGNAQELLVCATNKFDLKGSMKLRQFHAASLYTSSFATFSH